MDPIRPLDYPFLRRITWNRRPEMEVSPEDVLALYERNWRHVDEEHLEPHERALIDFLVRTEGNGVFHAG